MMRTEALVLAAALLAGSASAQEAETGWTVVTLRTGEVLAWSAPGPKPDDKDQTAILKTFSYSSSGHGVAGGNLRFHYQVSDMVFVCDAARYSCTNAALAGLDGDVVAVVPDDNRITSVRPNTLDALWESAACRGVVIAGMDDLPVVRDATITSLRNFDSMEEAMAGARSMVLL